MWTYEKKLQFPVNIRKPDRSITPDILVFAGMLVVFSVLSILFYRWKTSVSEEHFEKTLLAQFH